MAQQFSLLEGTPSPVAKYNTRSGTFTDNMKLPIHRWFRYSAGFSAEWAKKIIQEFSPLVVLDPFVGSGTTLLAAEQCGVKSFGFESHPFVARIARAKLYWGTPVGDISSVARELIYTAQKLKIDTNDAPELLHKCYDKKSLEELYALKDAFLSRSPDIGEGTKEIIWLALTSILRACSHVGTAQWQYLLPNKKKTKVLTPFQAFESKINDMTADMRMFQSLNCLHNSNVVQHDARLPYNSLKHKVDLVVTSPPYPNNYDYADATRLEMCFWGEIEKWGDLQQTVRKYIIRSCSQHATADKLKLDNILNDALLAPIHADLSSVCNQLEEIRHSHGGKKAYHLMVAAYFSDIAKIFLSLRDMCKRGSTMCFVIGDSAPYGIYVPVDEFLGRLATNVGFSSYSFEKIRDRNIKWKNRKHRVPLQEGRLWIKG